MAGRDDEAAARAERARAIGLFRYQLIREAADPALSTRARGRLVRAVAAVEHTDPGGRRVRVSRDTLDRWIRAWRRGGFDALVPSPRQSAPRLPVEVIEMAVALKRENPERTARAGRPDPAHPDGVGAGRADPATLVRRPGPDRARSPGGAEPVFGRFEAVRPNELWTGDALHGPHVGGRKTYLFAFLDDHSRAIMGHRFGFAEDTVRLAAALRPALGLARGPRGDLRRQRVRVRRRLAAAGVRETRDPADPLHPRAPTGPREDRAIFPHRPRAVPRRDHRNPEGEPGRHPVTDLGELNGLFTAWVETVYHRRIHSETAAAPLARWMAGGPFPLPEPRRAGRGVPLGGTPHRHQDRHGVAARQHLPGRPRPGRAPRRAGVRPLRPHPIEARLARCPGRPGDPAPDRAPRPPQGPTRNTPDPHRPAPTGIDYARLIDTAHQTELAHGVNYAALPRHTGTRRQPQRRACRTTRPVHRPRSPAHHPQRRPHDSAGGIMIDRLQGFFGFTRTPFGRDLAPGMLHRHTSHGEAVARIGWCITERRIGVITGEVGAGKTVADPRRPARPGPHPAHHHLPTQPHRRRPRHPPPNRRRPRQRNP